MKISRVRWVESLRSRSDIGLVIVVDEPRIDVSWDERSLRLLDLLRGMA